MGKSRKFYAVARGRRPGIYSAWSGADGAEEQIRGYAGSLYKGFPSIDEAKRWLQNPTTGNTQVKISDRTNEIIGSKTTDGRITVFTDGGCLGNPGPGGYGVVIIDACRRIELSQGYRLTTNNRMEMMACISALESLKRPADVLLYSDSRYVVNGVNQGWACKWRANNWMRTQRQAAENADLWAILLDLCAFHRVEFVWLRGHAGHRENERCDELAAIAASGPNLKEDSAYVAGRTRGIDSLFDEKS
ncbi:MAG: ribonuclease HI [Deltaproteobacteria bacterium]|nr:ribonuclease HI [Deltaproteobacteria bacterium]